MIQEQCTDSNVILETLLTNKAPIVSQEGLGIWELYLFKIWDVVSYILDQLQTVCEAKDDFELLNLLPLPPE